MPDLTFKQAIVVAAIPSLIGIAATYYSKDVSDKQAVVQARMTERDLTHQEAIKASTKEQPVYAYMIPVSFNTAWGNYYVCRADGKESRLSCAEKQRNYKMDLTPELVKNQVEFGF